MGSHQDEDAGEQLDAAVGIYWLLAPPLVRNALVLPVGHAGNSKVVVKLRSFRVMVVVVAEDGPACLQLHFLFGL